jgi:hypothetical protein
MASYIDKKGVYVMLKSIARNLILLSGLSGLTSIQAQPPKNPPLPPVFPAGGGMALGHYDCFGASGPLYGMAFTVNSPSKYTDSENKQGTYLLDKNGGRVQFKGGMLEGVFPKGFYGVYYSREGRPVLGIRSPSGSQSSYCEWVR